MTRSKVEAVVDTTLLAAADLGVRDGEVAIAEHDTRWALIFDQLAELIEAALAAHEPAVEHIGSTAVADLAAKPLIDIAVGIGAPIDVEAVVAALVDAGFDYRGDLGVYGGLLFIAESAPGVVAVNVHVVDIDDFQWRWYLAFRDGLRANPEIRRQYEALKRASAEDHAADRDGYNQAKFDWVLATARTLGEQ